MTNYQAANNSPTSFHQFKMFISDCLTTVQAGGGGVMMRGMSS